MAVGEEVLWGFQAVFSLRLLSAGFYSYPRIFDTYRELVSDQASLSSLRLLGACLGDW